MQTKIHNLKNNKKIRQKLRNTTTKSEKKLWSEIKQSRLGYKFRRQHGIANYIVDFYCPDLQVIIEIDGYIHAEDYQTEKDKKRQKFLENKGFNILRYRNEQVLYEIDSVLQDIKNKLDLIINHP
ncbi:MAG: hypothetical protein A2469_01165 [Candidatus Magasanikbacteria bacterium RIFOXYC2_FULL_40_16]|uniref:DUF559 domain-containing protein n=3 Tax=Candidatus Magasanikiibacteriota TaxID=1752731 RepID=A0A1F6NG31_9BACT|nr:MAG: hypothetical protein A2224_02180 [Candidatus Magasanikbacteria bacterium RIFOXYA2_FULL_40_20]OGH82877.1 MAG: hypothetical protein A2373_02600 [Candidatus Magasanikbacteria bacterium RIFOXYB1_FULL_40_15]OGH85902.1 MAG: hypothetical protein A2301_02370 [Candidatus Magasanikbacteria bacterium RIFOXYB2_FULL_40_13]OGH87092.1 MAG: hypothetical protein A2206_03245 [Candidatus Magasanikbacteria bacterium RIFOXYA1_FULL_40_8]OGH89808.1 MAG: hypothetical protein A2469_01165 [Candidatus Magasanikba